MQVHLLQRSHPPSATLPTSPTLFSFLVSPAFPLTPSVLNKPEDLPPVLDTILKPLCSELRPLAQDPSSKPAQSILTPHSDSVL